MKLTTLCYIEKDDAMLMLHRIKKDHDVNKGKWIGVGGKFEAGESPDDCLLREVREETGAQVRVRPGYREVTTYSPAKGVTKDVVFFVAEITGGTLRAQPEEVRAVCLLPLEEAQRRLTYAADKELLEKAKNMILDEKNG